MISVCMATYNGERYLIEQVESILTQIGEEDELIISDDDSSDDTVNILKSIKDKRVKIFQTKIVDYKFKIDKIAHNFENALKNAKGDVIFLADQDDVWCANKVAVMSGVLSSHDVAVSDCYVVDEDLNLLYDSYYDDIRKPRKSVVGNFIKSSFLGSCMAFKKAVLEESFPFPQYGVGHDLWIGLIGLKKFNVAFVPERLIKYRRHDNVATNAGKKGEANLRFKLAYRTYLLKAIMTL